jgi:hypothetical protein
MVTNTLVKLMVAGASCAAGSVAMAATTFANGGFDYGTTPTVVNDTTTDSSVYFENRSNTSLNDYVATSPWFTDTNTRGEVLLSDGSSTGSSFAHLTGSGSEIVQWFSVDETATYRISFDAWGTGRIVLSDSPFIWQYDSVLSQTNLSQSMASTAFVYGRTDSLGGTGVAINNTNSGLTLGHYSFDVTLTAGKSYDLFAAQGLTADAVNSPNGTGMTGSASNFLNVDNFAVAEVPEPESYAMMLAGLVALGFMARRRRNDAPSTAF